MTIREQLYDAVSDQSAEACINQHTRTSIPFTALTHQVGAWSQEKSNG